MLGSKDSNVHMFVIFSLKNHEMTPISLLMSHSQLAANQRASETHFFLNGKHNYFRSSSSLLKKKIEQHAFQTNTAEWQKEQDYKIIRERRKKLRRQINAKLKLVKRLFILSVLGIILGVIVLFGSTIRTLGDGSIFWTHKTYFKYVGVFLIVAGVILLLSAVGMESHSLDKLKQEGIVEVKPFIHPDFLLESDQKISSPEYSPDNNYNTNCTGLDKQQLLWKQEHNDGEEGFLCSSISSATSNSQVQGNDLTSRWARAMTMSFDACDAGQKSPQGEANAKNILVRKNSAQLRALNNAPSIEISTVDEISNCKSRSSSSSSIFGSFSGSSSGSSIHRVKVNDHEKSFKSTADESNVLKSGAPLHNISEESLAVIDDRKITSSHLVM